MSLKYITTILPSVTKITLNSLQLNHDKTSNTNAVTYITYVTIFKLGTGRSFFGSGTVEILEKFHRYVFHFLTKCYDDELK